MDTQVFKRASKSLFIKDPKNIQPPRKMKNKNCKQKQLISQEKMCETETLEISEKNEEKPQEPQDSQEPKATMSKRQQKRLLKLEAWEVCPSLSLLILSSFKSISNSS